MSNWLSDLFNKPTREKPSPKIRIRQDQVHINTDGVLTVTGLKGCYLAALEPSNSMVPGMDDGMFVVLDPLIPFYSLVVGDAIYFETPGFRAIHRIVEKGVDKDGEFLYTKGDNNSRGDGVKVREHQIKGVWRATLN